MSKNDLMELYEKFKREKAVEEAQKLAMQPTYTYNTTIHGSLGSAGQKVPNSSSSGAGGTGYGGGWVHPITFGSSATTADLISYSTDNLESLITKCGKNFYYLVSPEASSESDGLWHAKGKKATGKGTTAVLAMQNLLEQLTTDE